MMIFKDKVKEFKLFVCIAIFLATLLGIYSQQIAYFCSGEYGTHVRLTLGILTISTILSILLFIATPILICLFMKKVKVEKSVVTSFIIYILADISLAIPTTMFSVFVLVMSWG